MVRSEAEIFFNAKVISGPHRCLPLAIVGTFLRNFYQGSVEINGQLSRRDSLNAIYYTFQNVNKHRQSLGYVVMISLRPCLTPYD